MHCLLCGHVPWLGSQGVSPVPHERVRVKNLGRAALVIVLALLAMAAVMIFVGYVLPMFFVAVAEVPWVASTLILLAFVIILIRLPRRGWSPEGTLLLIGVVLVGTIFDAPGNPIYNAPFEALFLEPGQQLQSHAIVETIGGETHVSNGVAVVDSDGEFVRNLNWVLMALYRGAIYFGLYSILLTVSALFPHRRKKADTDVVVVSAP